ncbi:MAG: 3-methyl-2-oxobutanoate hydroxymethyltransferase [Candidatus Marinimicrobia bacterium]|nr:3-methyl-2-oxobutanoate hydroxymethyltransferase [Candidatus Neomarinimicrobiota bacterium]
MDKVTTKTIRSMKKSGEKIVALTAYDYTFAYLIDEAGVDLVLVGDSAAMVCAGYENTLPITLEQMLYHVSSVKRGLKRALLIADMPFLSYQVNEDEAIKNAGLFLKAGAEAVKIEGGKPVCNLIRRMVDIGIPVLGHLGLTPQSIHEFGGYRLRGKDEDEAVRIKEDAKAVEEAGAFALVLEKVPANLAKEITRSIKIPTIGIGAGPYCDGQILVLYDMLGLYDKVKFKFVRRYANLGDEIRKAVKNYAKDIKEGKFPSNEESY